jgi:nicotinate-nucleotide pyrophosphorylase
MAEGGFNTYRVIGAARKNHRCVWCNDAIVIGESHIKFVGHCEGDFQSWRIHNECKPRMEESPAYEEDNLICEGPHLRGGECEC